MKARSAASTAAPAVAVIVMLLSGCAAPSEIAPREAHATTEEPCPQLAPVTGALPAILTTTAAPTLVAAPAVIDEASVTTTQGATLYDASFTAVGRIEATLPWESTPQPIVIIDENTRCGLALVLSIARGDWASTASTVGWVRITELAPTRFPAQRLVIDLSDGVVMLPSGERVAGLVPGAAETATPIATGYLASVHTSGQASTKDLPVGLTSLHSTSLESYEGNAGEIGLHATTMSNSGSHGCIRVPDSVSAQLPSFVGALVEVRA